MSILADFKARFPAIDEATADQYVPIIESEYRAYYNREYNDNSKEAILHLIAHLVVVESRGDDAPDRPATSQSADGVSESFQGIPESRSRSVMQQMFSTTRYGQRFLLLTSYRGGGVAV